MMCDTVLPYQTCTVYTERHRQMLDSHIVDDMIISALQERAVDGTEWMQTLLGKSAAECDGMPFGDADIKCALRKYLL